MTSKTNLEDTSGNVEKLRLSALYSLDVLDNEADPDLDIITRLASDRFGTPIALVSLVDEHRQWFKSRHGLEATETPRDSSFCSYAITSNEVMVVLDALSDARFNENHLVLAAPQMRFYAGAPLILTNGCRIGTLCVIDRKPRTEFSPRDSEILALMARQVVAVLENHYARKEQRISQLIARTTSDAFICSDAEGRIILWNRAAQDMFGWSSHEALGQTLDLIVPQRHQSAHNAGMAHVVRSRRTKLVGRTVEIPVTCKDGQEIPVELSLAMWPSVEEGAPEGFAAIMRDISTRKQSEARLSEQIAALDASNDGIAFTDSDGIFVFMNQAHARMFGYDDPGELIGLNWSILYNEEEANRLDREAMPRLARDGQWRGETKGRKRDGSIVEQEIALSLSAAGGIVCVTRDIGQRLEVEREEARLREQLTQAQRQEVVGQLASGIAHDFNNLIAAIAGTTHLLLDHEDSIVRQSATRIHSATSTATSLVEKLLTLGQRKRISKPVDLRKMVRNVRDLLKPSMIDPRHTIELGIPDEPLVAVTDETEVTQVIMNLALNANSALTVGQKGRIKLELMNASGQIPRGTVMAGLIPKVPAALIRVSDNGIGIPEEFLGRIFEPFYSHKGNGGTGLGLAVVSSIINDIGGAIAVESRPGAGATFEIWWPLEPPSIDNDTQTDLPEGKTGELLGKAILIVDDNEVALETLTSALEGAGAEVGPCIHPSDVIAILEDDASAWDLLITDYDMPSMNGAQLAQLARTLREDLPIILLTGLPKPGLLPSASRRLFDAILQKPATRDIIEKAAYEAFTAATKRGI